MEKLIYLLGGTSAGHLPEPGTALRDALRGIAPSLEDAGARGARCFTADLDDPALAAFPQMNAHGLLDAMVTLWLDSLDSRDAVEAILSPLAARLAGYLVTESVPRPCAVAPSPDGTVPGVTLVSTFDKPAELDADTFLARWHGSHTPLSLEIHPLQSYVRNAVVRPVTRDAPALRAIVSESVATLDDLVDPTRFYGNEENRKRATRDLLSFADLATMSAVVMSESILVPEAFSETAHD